MSIKSRIIIFLMLGIVMVSSILLYASGYFSQRLIESYLYDYLKAMHQSIGKSIETMIDEVNMLSVRLLGTNEIYNLLEDENIPHDEKNIKLKNILDRVVSNKQLIGDIFIVTNHNEVFRYMEDAKPIQKPDEVFINEIEKAAKSVGVWGTVKKDADGNAYILLGRRYYNFNSDRKLGYLIIYIRESALCDMYKKTVDGKGYSFLVSGEDYIISHPDMKKVGYYSGIDKKIMVGYW